MKRTVPRYLFKDFKVAMSDAVKMIDHYKYWYIGITRSLNTRYSLDRKQIYFICTAFYEFQTRIDTVSRISISKFYSTGLKNERFFIRFPQRNALLTETRNTELLRMAADLYDISIRSPVKSPCNLLFMTSGKLHNSHSVCWNCYMCSICWAEFGADGRKRESLSP